MFHEYFINFARRDLLATAVDDLFQAPGESYVTGGVHHALVPRAKPSGVKRSAVRFRIVFVTVRHVRAADDDLAGLPAATGHPLHS